MKSRWSAASKFVARRACALAVCGAASAAWAGYEVPSPAYVPPTHYYDGATSSVGSTLKSQLNAIIKSGFVSRSYDDVRQADQLLDLDPNNPNNILLIYNRASVPKAWDGGDTWNREHQWPDSRGLNGSGKDYSDLFNLRPCNQPINSSRGNDPYGSVNSTGSYGANGAYWFPGDADKGDAARTLFYMAVRYDGTESGTLDLELVNGDPGAIVSGSRTMGDLQSLLKYHYTDGVDNFERRRNQLIYGSSGDLTNHALNPTYYQGNRNPFVDHPEYVWAIFGGGNNNSQLSVGGASLNADGSSSATIDLGTAIVGATLPTGSFTLNKTGANPTTFDVTASGLAAATVSSALQVGAGQPFDYGAGSRTMTVQLTGAAASAGVKSGTISVNNTDLTTGGAGLGSADGNDTVTVTATILDHATPHFIGVAGTSLEVDFGYVPVGFAARSLPFAITNTPAASGLTADLALTDVTGGGATSRLTHDVTPFAHLAAGDQNAYAATVNPTAAGNITADYAFNMSDQTDLLGHAARPSIFLNLFANVISSATFPATGFLQLNDGETYDTGPFSVAAGVTLTKSGPGTMNVTGAQSNGAGSSLAITGGGVTMVTDAGSAASPVLSVSTANAGTSVTFVSSQHLAGLTVGAGTTVTVMPGGPKVLSTGPLSLAGTLDLSGNDAIVIADPETVRAYLLAGRAGGSWAGPAITSSAAAGDARHTTAIAYAPASVLGTTFDGEALDPAAVVLKYTWYGDANLDGTISPDDYALLDRGLAAALTGWTDGDFDYNGTVDAADYLLIDTSFGLQSGTLSAAMLADREARFGGAYVAELIAAVPEPSTLGFVCASFVLATRRSRRA